MAGEDWAQHIVARALNRTVDLHDDNKRPSLYDLRIGPIDAPEVAIEVVGAVDAQYTETWNRGPGQGSLRLAVRGNWTVVISPHTKLRTIKPQLERLIQEMEASDRYSLREDQYRSEADEALLDAFEALSIQHAFCSKVEGIGKVYLTMDGSGGAVDEAGTTLPTWIGEFLCHPKRADVLLKLDKSGAPQREVFIIATLCGTPWAVEGYLTGTLDQLPSAAPDLPAPVTGVWIVSSSPFYGRGVRWDDAGWHFFDV